MPIRLRLPVEITTVEIKASLRYKKKREDIANLLLELKKGETLHSIFPSSPAVANAVSTKLKRENLLDGSGSLTSKADEFIANPLLPMEEEGIFSIDYCYLPNDELDVSFVPQVMRKLSSDKAEKGGVDLANAFPDVEFGIDATERGYMSSIDASGANNAFLFEKGMEILVFNLSQGDYEFKGKRFRLGDQFSSFLFEYAIEEAKSLFPQCELTENFSVVIRRIEDFEMRSLLAGVTTLTNGPIELIDVPLLIKDRTVAEKYVFLWLHERLMSGNYYSLEEMGELVQNELATSPIIDDSLRDYVSTIAVSRYAFHHYLPQDKYLQLDYRLKVIEEYLGVQCMKDTVFSRAQSYPELASIIANAMPPSEVSHVYLVMGYPYVKKKNNRILEGLDALKMYYPNITMVLKKWQGKPNQEEDPNLRALVAQKGITLKDKEGLIDIIHDRYLIFELKKGGHQTIICTCEYGQFFASDEHSSKGMMFKINNSETVKGDKSLLQMIKE